MEAGGSEFEGLGGLGVEGLGGCGIGARDGDAAIDQVADHAFGVEGAADGVGLHADADEVVRVEAVESLCGADAHRSILPFVEAGNRAVGAAGRVGRKVRGERGERYGGAEGIGILRCAQDDGKNKQRQEQKQIHLRG